MTFYSHNNTNLYYRVEGESGPWVTLINGFTRTSEDFKFFVKSLHEANFRTITLDNRGSGQTQSSPNFTISQMAHDVINLWNHLSIKKAAIIGLSMGGMIAQEISLIAPHLVENLVLVSTASSSNWHTSDQSLPPDSPDKVEEYMKLFFSVEFLRKNQLLVKSMAKQIIKSKKEDPAQKNARSQRAAINQFDLSDEIRNIIAHTLIIHGEEDRVINFNAAKELKNNILESKLEIIPGKGHLLLAECPQLLKTMCIDFLQENNSDS